MGSGYDIRSAELGVITRGGLVARSYWGCHDGRTSGLPYNASFFPEWFRPGECALLGIAASHAQGAGASLPGCWRTVKGGADA